MSEANNWPAPRPIELGVYLVTFDSICSHSGWTSRSQALVAAARMADVEMALRDSDNMVSRVAPEANIEADWIAECICTTKPGVIRGIYKP